MILIDSARFDQLITASLLSNLWPVRRSRGIGQQPTWKMRQNVID